MRSARRSSRCRSCTEATPRRPTGSSWLRVAVLFAKTHAAPPAGFFTTEATGLAWLRESGAVRVPEVLAVSDGSGEQPAFLALEWIEPRRSSGGPIVGRVRVRARARRTPRFWRPLVRTRGPAHHRQSRAPERSVQHVGGVRRQRRFLPLARIARDRGSLPPDVVDRLESLANTLDRFDDGAGPARLHGDLWAGNRVVDADGASWLIDPAAHGGHPEFDLAMMRLFGGFGSDAFSGYETVSPLADGWRDRGRAPPDRPARRPRHQVRRPLHRRRHAEPSTGTPDPICHGRFA